MIYFNTFWNIFQHKFRSLRCLSKKISAVEAAEIFFSRQTGVLILIQLLLQPAEHIPEHLSPVQLVVHLMPGLGIEF